MKILTIHADFVEYEAKKKAFKSAEEDIEEGKQRMDECLVVYTAVEKRDENSVSNVVKRYVEEVKKVAEQVNTKNIVIYPYAHLSSNLSNPEIAEEVLKKAEVSFPKEYNIKRAPFGWYKSFTVSCKGHPLSELSREFSGEETTTLKRESKDEPFVLSDKKLTNDEMVLLSGALLTAKAVKSIYPEAEIGSSSFYQDQAYIDIANVKIKNEDWQKIENKVLELAKENLVFAKVNNLDLSELQQQIYDDCKGECYQLNGMQIVSLFQKPYVYSSKDIGAFKILNIGSAYWKNNEKNPQLSRIYCVSFSSVDKLADYQRKQEEAQNRSHLKIGKEQGLFVVSKYVGAGLPLLAPKGAILKNQLISFLWDLHKHKGYQQVSIPHIAKDLLYKKSGHWEKFGDELFHVKGKHEDFVLKPMNCPHHIQIYDNFSFSYRDLPVRYFEPTTVYRDEKPGQLIGLSRVRSITQDDGHIFCRISQIKEEVKTIVEIILCFYGTLQMDKDYWVSLSVRGDDQSKYLGSSQVWEIAEKSLEEVAIANKLPFKKIRGEAAFYGPKLDFMFKDALGRQWQLATIQLDFNLPERFELGYMNEESKKERPVMIHRAISGSLERFMSVLIEHFSGKFPLWLSPVQVKIITINDSCIPFAKEVYQQMSAAGLRVEINDQAESMGKKVRDAQMEKVNYIVTIGEKEVEKKVLAIRTRNGDLKFNVYVPEFISELVKEVEKKEIK